MTGWQDIRAEVLARIRTRDWPPGARIPDEVDLARDFGVARATVNRALQALAEEGWIERRRRAGTRVAAHPIRQARLAIPILRAEIESQGARHGHRLLARQEGPAPAPVCARLSLPPGTALLHLLSLHLADDAPFALEDRRVNVTAVPDIAKADLAAISANEWLVANAPFSHGDYEIAAAPASADQAHHLGCATGAALLQVTRTTWAGAAPITWVRLTHAPDHRIRMSL